MIRNQEREISMINEKKISIEKVISDIKESNGNGKRKGCHGLHQCLSDDGYIRQIVCWTRITSPDRIDALVEHADKQSSEITALRTALTALTSQLESVVAENAALKAVESNLVRNIINDLGDTEFQYEKVQTPATDAFLAEVRASARNEGINYAAGRLSAAFNAGFVDKPLAEVCDVVRMILDAKEDLANSRLPADDGLSGEYAEKFLAEFAAQLRQVGAE